MTDTTVEPRLEESEKGNEVSVEEMQTDLQALLERVAAGEKIAIVHQGRTIARLAPPRPAPKRFPDLSEFRASIEIKGETPMEALRHLRDEAL